MNLLRRTSLIRQLLSPPAAEHRGVLAQCPRAKQSKSPLVMPPADRCFGFTRAHPGLNQPQPRPAPRPHYTPVDHCFPIAGLCAAV